VIQCWLKLAGPARCPKNSPEEMCCLTAPWRLIIQLLAVQMAAYENGGVRLAAFSKREDDPSPARWRQVLRGNVND